MNSVMQKTSPIRPRDASSLVIYKQQNNSLRVLMGKRAKAHRFLPNVFVFPGGRVDTADHQMQAHRPLPSQTATLLSNSGASPHGIACAAVRETHEETGLAIGPLKEGQLQPDLSNLKYLARAITPVHNPIRFNARFLMIEAEHATGELAGSGELLHLQWFDIDDALAMPLVDVTEFVLLELKNRLNTAFFDDRVTPLFTYRNGKPVIRRISHTH